MNLVEQINRLLGTHSQEMIGAGQVVKAMILKRMPHFTRKKTCNKWNIFVGCREYQTP
ncbi:MAG: DUF4277 domain-containing protein [Nostoc sp. DedSLP01]